MFHNIDKTQLLLAYSAYSQSGAVQGQPSRSNGSMHLFIYPPRNSPHWQSKRRFVAAGYDHSLVQILPGGNSDPFNTQGIPITPEINKLVSFIRDAYLPGIYITAYMKNRDYVPGAPLITTIGEGFHVFGRRTVAKVWSSMKEELSDEGRALSWCASYIPVLAKFSSPETAQELNMLAIKMRTKSMVILKDQVEKLALDVPPDISLISHIISLFRAACKEGDIPAAKIHAGIVRRLVDRVEVRDKHIQTLFMTCMNNDGELALARMHHTFFDFQNWVTKQIRRFWDEAEVTKPPVPEEDKALHKSIQLDATRRPAIRLRHNLSIRSLKVNLNNPEDLDRTYAVYTNFSIYAQLDTGILLNIYLDLITDQGYDHLKGGVRLIEASIALLTLHVLRRGIFEATVYGCDHRSSHHIILINHLEGTMRRLMNEATEAELDQYCEALLWIAFYGARFEWRVNQKIKGLTPPRTWFAKLFVRQAQALELSDWFHARDIIRQFVFYEFLESYLPMWFEETMRGNAPLVRQSTGAAVPQKHGVSANLT